MKKLATLILAGLITLAFTACSNSTGGSNESSANVNNSTGSESVQQSAESSTPESSTADYQKVGNVDLPMVYRVIDKDIFVNVPAYQEINYGYTEVFTVGRNLHVAVTYDGDKTAVTSLEDAHKKTFDWYKIGIQNYKTVDGLKVEKDETMEVNGIKVYRFEGKLQCHYEDDKYEIYTVGYSFIMDGIACSIEGTVLDKSQPEEMITEVRNDIDAMIQTLRSTE